jgi:hypothetical protein
MAHWHMLQLTLLQAFKWYFCGHLFYKHSASKADKIYWKPFQILFAIWRSTPFSPPPNISSEIILWYEITPASHFEVQSSSKDPEAWQLTEISGGVYAYFKISHNFLYLLSKSAFENYLTIRFYITQAVEKASFNKPYTYNLHDLERARGSVVGWGTML